MNEVSPKLATSAAHAMNALGVPKEQKYHDLAVRLALELTNTLTRILNEAGASSDAHIGHVGLATQITWTAMSAGHSLGKVEQKAPMAGMYLAGELMRAFGAELGDAMRPFVNLSDSDCNDPNCPVHGKPAGEPAAPDAPPPGAKLH